MDAQGATYARLDATAARWRMVGDSVVVMDLRNSAYFSVEGSVTAVWPRLEQGALLSDLARELASEFDADPEQILADITAIVEALEARGIAKVERANVA